MMLRLLTVVALVASVLVGTSTAACACSCVTFVPEEAVGRADAAFTGTVVNVHTGDARPRGPIPPTVYTFRADHVYKGSPAAEYVVAANVHSSSCGYTFEMGTRYLVFATTGDSGLGEEVRDVSLFSSLCAGNVPVKAGTGPLRVGDERTTSHETLVSTVDADLITALGTPERVPEISSSVTQTATVTSSPAGGTGAESGTSLMQGWAVGGLAFIGLALLAGFGFTRRRRPR
jgi:hypothetical protein